MDKLGWKGFLVILALAALACNSTEVGTTTPMVSEMVVESTTTPLQNETAPLTITPMSVETVSNFRHPGLQISNPGSICQAVGDQQGFEVWATGGNKVTVETMGIVTPPTLQAGDGISENQPFGNGVMGGFLNVRYSTIGVGAECSSSTAEGVQLSYSAANITPNNGVVVKVTAINNLGQAMYVVYATPVTWDQLFVWHLLTESEISQIQPLP